MPIEVDDTASGHGSHVVQYYERDSDLVDGVTHYLTEGLGSEESVVIVATEAHRRAFERALQTSGESPTELRRQGRLLALDAGQTLSRFMSDGRVDPATFLRRDR